MKVIFLKDVPRIAKKNDVKEMNDGYAINFLFPRKLAKVATAQALKELEISKKDIILKKEIQEDLLFKNLEEIKNKQITIKAKADEKGSLFSSISKKDMVQEMEKEYRAQISENFIILDKPIKQIGEFEIPIQIKNKKSFFKLVIERI